MLLIIAVVSMFFAVTAYTTAVFMEKKVGMIKANHLIIFTVGLLFDTIGTTSMSRISEGFTFDLHGLTGIVALVLMLLHVILAYAVYIKGTIRQKKNFHKYSFYIWLLWLVPFVSGMALNM